VSAARIERRLLRKLLREATCAGCGGAVDERGHRALWIDAAGRVIPHLVCNGCAETAQASQQACDALATRCALAVCEPGGRA
jgi:hypothetical protein